MFQNHDNEDVKMTTTTEIRNNNTDVAVVDIENPSNNNDQRKDNGSMMDYKNYDDDEYYVDVVDVDDLSMADIEEWKSAPMTATHHSADPFARREGKTLLWKDVNMILVCVCVRVCDVAISFKVYGIVCRTARRVNWKVRTF